ncbi:MAG: hypothetical protein LBM93_14530 [Oscillospiraceae bacterium]|jgi:hypothetical protein|nr:hypothetical protein [Oscillospiraceae bacterium]
MDDYKYIWENFINELLLKKYDRATELWDPDTRNVFIKNAKSFHKKHKRWKIVEYCGVYNDDYIIIKYLSPQGFIAKSIYAFNKYKSGNKNLYGKIISILYNYIKNIREYRFGRINSLCGVLLKHFDVLSREFCNYDVVKKYSIIKLNNKIYIGWSYAKSIIPKSICHIYEYDTFIFKSVIDYSIHIPMLRKLDIYIKNVIKDINISVPKINIYFHAEINNPQTGIPKAFFTVPGKNDICIYSIRVNYNTLRHEMLHAIISSATSSWPPLFFREGYAESYAKTNETYINLLKQNYPIKLLTNDLLFFDYTEVPPAIAGIFVKYLIQKYGVNKFYSVYSIANDMNVKKTLKREYSLTIHQLKNEVLDFLKATNN